MSSPDLLRLAQAVKTRRLALGLARSRAADEAAIAVDTWKRIETGRPVREMNYAKVDQVLGWAVGSCTAIAGGGSPTPVQRSASDPAVTIADVSDSERVDAARRVIESASIAVTDLSAGEIRELSARIIEDLKRRDII